MKKLFIIAFIAVLGFGSAAAQDYTTSGGLRGGAATGLTLKHFISETAALEGIATLRWGGVNLTGLFEIHKGRVADVEYLNWYFGGGAHVGTWRHYSWSDRHFNFGFDGIIGVEYTLTDLDLPFNVSFDYKPAFNLGTYSGFTGDEFALSVRYIF